MNKSFTLIEILVVIVVIGVLSAFILVGMSSITNSANIAKGKAFSNSLRNSLLMNLVSEWKFEGSTSENGTVTINDAKDYWGSSSAVAVGGNPVVKGSSNCVSGKCIYLDGSGDYIDCGNHTSLGIINSITISGWVNWSVAATKEMFVKMDSANTAVGPYEVFQNVNNIIFRTIKGTAVHDLTSATSLSTNTWIYVVAMWDGVTKSIYINGIKDANTQTEATPIDSSTGKFIIGAYATGIYSFYGYMDEVSIYNSAVPVSQIQQNYFVGINNLFKNSGITSNEFNQRIVELKSNMVENE